MPIAVRYKTVSSLVLTILNGCLAFHVRQLPDRSNELWTDRLSAPLSQSLRVHTNHIIEAALSLLAPCVNYAKINNSILRMRGHVFAGFLRCDVLLLQGKHNSFRHIVASA